MQRDNQVKKPTVIELPPEYTAFIVDEHGNLVEFYMPDKDENTEVPDKIVEALNVFIKDMPNES